MWFSAGPDDPRSHVTETGFRVDPDLLGRPLAHPLRRLAALLVDLAAVGGLVLLKAISLPVFALGGGWLLWRVADPDTDVHLPGRRLRLGLRVVAVAGALIGAFTLVGSCFEGSSDREPGARQTTSAGGAEAPDTGAAPRAADSSPPPASSARRRRARREEPPDSAAAGIVADLRQTVAADSARRIAVSVGRRLLRRGETRDAVREQLEDVLEEGEEAEPPWEGGIDAILRDAMQRLDTLRRRRRAARDSLLARFEQAAARRDTEELARLAPQLARRLPPPRAEQLEARIARLEAELDRAREPPSVVEAAWGLLNDLGLGLGWLGLYFTAVPVLWEGRTPGKWLLRTRVVRIDGERLTTWDTFSRFGGYAAGGLTGLLGFAQVLWHPNRQALHDRIAGTVVVVDDGD